MNLDAILAAFFRRPPKPEAGDDLDGCELDFRAPYDGPPVRLLPDPPPDRLGVPEPGAKRG